MVLVHRTFFSLLFIALLSSCKSTCEKAVEKTISCAPSPGLKSELRQSRDLAIAVCSPHEDEVKNCIKLNDCVEFHRCMKKAVVFREAPPRKLPEAPPEETQKKPEEIEKEPSAEPAAP